MIDVIKEYASKRTDLLKLEATEKTSLSAGVITYLVIIAIAFFFFIILFNIGIGLLIGYYLNNYAFGILIMSGFYFFIILMTLLLRNIIKNTIANKIIQLLS